MQLNMDLLNEGVVYLFAYKNNTTYSNYINKYSAECVINNIGFFAKTFAIEPTDSISTTYLKYNDIADVSDSFEYAFENSGLMINGEINTCTVTPIYENPITLRQIIEKNPHKRYYLGENIEKWIYLKGAKKIERISKNGHKYIFSEGAIEFPDSLDKPARTILTSESSVNRSTHVIEDPITKQLRLLTPVEAERIQGFDDNWTNTGMPEKFRYFCMGNALVVGLVERMGNTLNKIFDKEESMTIFENKIQKVV